MCCERNEWSLRRITPAQSSTTATPTITITITIWRIIRQNTLQKYCFFSTYANTNGLKGDFLGENAFFSK